MGEKVPSLCKRPLFVNSVPYKGRLVSPASYGNRAALGPSLPSLVPSLPSRKKRNGMAQPTLPAPRPPSIGLCSNPPEDALPPGSPLVHTSSVLCASLCLGYPFCRGKKNPSRLRTSGSPSAQSPTDSPSCSTPQSPTGLQAMGSSSRALHAPSTARHGPHPQHLNQGWNTVGAQ